MADFADGTPARNVLARYFLWSSLQIMTKLFNSVFTDSEMREEIYPFVATNELESSSKSTHLSVLTFT